MMVSQQWRKKCMENPDFAWQDMNSAVFFWAQSGGHDGARGASAWPYGLERAEAWRNEQRWDLQR